MIQVEAFIGILGNLTFYSMLGILGLTSVITLYKLYIWWVERP